MPADRGARVGSGVACVMLLPVRRKANMPKQYVRRRFDRIETADAASNGVAARWGVRPKRRPPHNSLGATPSAATFRDLRRLYVHPTIRRLGGNLGRVVSRTLAGSPSGIDHTK